MSEYRVIEGDCLEVLRDLDAGSAQTCITSPPYYGLRDYGHEGQIGLEETPEQYVANLVAMFREVRRVLRDDGTLWLNLGDSYYNKNPAGNDSFRSARDGTHYQKGLGRTKQHAGLKHKDLLGIPWMVAFALRADGWYLRSDIIWAKPNPMPESVTDRPTKAHEYLFLLSKSPRYYYNADAIRETSTTEREPGPLQPDYADRQDGSPRFGGVGFGVPAARNKRTVWTVATHPYPGAHFATFPPKLIEPCVLAGSRPGDVVLDPFTGAGTTGMVALRHDRDYVGIELSRKYAQMARDRIYDDGPLLNVEAA